VTKDITVVAVTSYAHELTRIAIDRTLDALPCKEVLVLSDKNIYPDGRWIEINPIGMPEYSKLMLKHLWPLVKTEHILVVQYDGMAIDGTKWSDDFLNYDYIGAIWPWAWHPPDNRVGNGGFSLRSKKLLHLLNDNRIVHDNRFQHVDVEDVYIGIYYKNLLVSNGAVIADVDTAQRFSQESPPSRQNTFGFHGSFNVPYYLGDDDAIEFIKLIPSWTNFSNVLMILHCFEAGRPLLGQLALELARLSSPDIDKRVRETLPQLPELLYRSPHIESLYKVLK